MCQRKSAPPSGQRYEFAPEKITFREEILVDWGFIPATSYFADIQKTYFSDGLKK